MAGICLVNLMNRDRLTFAHVFVCLFLCLYEEGLVLFLRLGAPAISLGFTILGEIFVCVTVFNPTIEAVTFRVRGWEGLVRWEFPDSLSFIRNENVTLF